MGKEMMKRPIFEAEQSHICFDNPKWINIGFWRWLWMTLDGDFVLRVKWIKK